MREEHGEVEESGAEASAPTVEKNRAELDAFIAQHRLSYEVQRVDDPHTEFFYWRYKLRSPKGEFEVRDLARAMSEHPLTLTELVLSIGIEARETDPELLIDWLEWGRSRKALPRAGLAYLEFVKRNFESARDRVEGLQRLVSTDELEALIYRAAGPLPVPPDEDEWKPPSIDAAEYAARVHDLRRALRPGGTLFIVVHFQSPNVRLEPSLLRPYGLAVRRRLRWAPEIELPNLTYKIAQVGLFELDDEQGALRVADDNPEGQLQVAIEELLWESSEVEFTWAERRLGLRNVQRRGLSVRVL